jgi:hypothetical protein
MWRLVSHRHGVTKQNLSLILVDRRSVYLGSGLAVGDHHVDPDASRQRTLPIAFAHLDERHSKAPGAVCRLPAEQAANDECLALVQFEWLPLEIPTVQSQYVLEETYCSPGSLNIPVEPSASPMLKVVQMPLARQAH